MCGRTEVKKQFDRINDSNSACATLYSVWGNGERGKLREFSINLCFGKL